MRFPQKIFCFCFCWLVAMSSTSWGAFGGHQVILIHGLWGPHLTERPDKKTIQQTGKLYWRNFWGQYVDERLDWGSHHRIEGQITAFVVEQVRDMVSRGVCDNGCIVVAHSTGALVMRYFLENQENWLDEPLDVVFIVDIAGAEGGSELSAIAVNVALGGESELQKQAVEVTMGFKPGAGIGVTGVLQDAIPNAARSLATAPSEVLRLRNAGTGYYGPAAGASHPFLLGEDDGIVALHSACGAAKKGSYESCSSIVGSDGSIGDYLAPSTFLYNYYPLIMTPDFHHTELITEDVPSIMTYVHNNLSNAEHFFHLDTVREDGFFAAPSQHLADSGKKSVSRVLYEMIFALPSRRNRLQVEPQSFTHPTGKNHSPSPVTDFSPSQASGNFNQQATATRQNRKTFLPSQSRFDSQPDNSKEVSHVNELPWVAVEEVSEAFEDTENTESIEEITPPNQEAFGGPETVSTEHSASSIQWGLREWSGPVSEENLEETLNSPQSVNVSEMAQSIDITPYLLKPQ